MAVSKYCKYCGRSIIPKSSYTNRQDYCSPACRKAAKQSVYNETRRNTRAVPTPIKRNSKLSADAMEAKMAKISYGQLMARRDRS